MPGLRGDVVTIILGLNAPYADSSACFAEDGPLVTVVEKARFRRIEHFAGFTYEAVQYWLNAVRATISLDWMRQMRSLRRITMRFRSRGRHRAVAVPGRGPARTR